MTWTNGHINPFWDNSFKNFKFLKQSISQNEINKWQKQGYTHTSFSGAMYGNKNPMPSWTAQIADKLKLKKCGYVIYKMSTNDIMPTHSDHYNRYCQIFDVKYNDVWRALVFLEDWKAGHYFEVDSVGVVNWKAGDYYLWNGDVPHAASNIGIQPRYTLQITGVT